MYIYKYLRLPFSRLNDELSNGTMDNLVPILAGALFDNEYSAEDVSRFIHATSFELNMGSDRTSEILTGFGLGNDVKRITIADNHLSAFKALEMVQEGSDTEMQLICATDRLIETPDISPNKFLAEKIDEKYTDKNLDMKGSFLKFAFVDSVKKSKWTLFENQAEKYNISRGEIDLYAHTSRVKYFNAVGRAGYAREIVAIKSKDKRGGSYFVDGGVALNPDKKQYEDSKPVSSNTDRITALNIAAPADGMVTLLVKKTKIKGSKLKPIAQVLGMVEEYGDPNKYIETGISTIKKACEKYDVKLKDISFFEIHENHPVTVIALVNRLKIPKKKVNLKGGSIATGDALAATGARLISSASSMLHLSTEKGRIALVNITSPFGYAATVLLKS